MRYTVIVEYPKSVEKAMELDERDTPLLYVAHVEAADAKSACLEACAQAMRAQPNKYRGVLGTWRPRLVLAGWAALECVL